MPLRRQPPTVLPGSSSTISLSVLPNPTLPPLLQLRSPLSSHLRPRALNLRLYPRPAPETGITATNVGLASAPPRTHANNAFGLHALMLLRARASLASPQSTPPHHHARLTIALFQRHHLPHLVRPLPAAACGAAARSGTPVAVMLFSPLVPVVASLASLASAASSFSPARPPAIPLAVKSPYLSAYQAAGLDGGNGGYLAGQFPTFWAGSSLGWAGLIRVDGTVFTWLGNPQLSDGSFPPVVNQTSFKYTATKSIFEMNVANAVKMIVTFTSNVDPNDMKRSSLPFSYMDVSVQSLSKKKHNVQLYTDISAEWISGNRSNIAQWNYGVYDGPSTKARRNYHYVQPDEPQLDARQAAPGDGNYVYGTKTDYSGWRTAVPHPSDNVLIAQTTPSRDPVPTSVPQLGDPNVDVADPPGAAAAGGMAYHQIFRQTQQEFSEVADQAEWGDWYYVTDNVAKLTHQSGRDVLVRGQFASKGRLTNAKDSKYRAINDTYPTFAFSKNIGKVGSDAVETTFGISLVQARVMQFAGTGTKLVPQNALWGSYFNSPIDAVGWFFNDFSIARTTSDRLDDKVEGMSIAKAGQNYADITALAYRQTFSALQFSGTPDNPLLWMKEISSDGNINTVDVIFPAMPVYLTINPTYIKLLLEPLFINQEAGRWPYAFSIHDIGSHYPNATGHPDGDAEQQPLEECGNMIIMSLAYAQRAKDTAYLSKHYKILKQWNQYLIEEALIPADQISTDDFAGSLANQTNLAIKGIIGISAMAQIANLTGHTKDYNNFTKISKSYVKQWQKLGLNTDARPPHSTLAYGMPDTHGLLYNIYSDKLLKLNLVPQSVFDMQSAFYPTISGKYGVPLDTRHSYTKADWEIWAGSVASQDTLDFFVKKIRTWIGETPTNRAFTDIYDVDTGEFATGVYFINRPVIGGVWAPLALDT
ncbi:hypothetical protein FH972_024625 [Carpinus fangiana]|uniref:Glutaminase n=1 Tax=Carpinus fangiana TaxID=176857 RepID=A0A5N6KZ22_9ROSI|nr:hypothetical protein FH972_024625 [Carpinus fangiana]